ncbi:MAG: hypothetical protein JWR52_3575 [Marmoricola sp.]|nr:hypothetical protein [Marmoricola sp.]
MIERLPGTLALTTVLALTAGCGGSTPSGFAPTPSASNPSPTTSSPTPTAVPTSTPTPTPSRPSGTPTSRAPVRLGEIVKIPDWTVQLIAVRDDATHAIIAASGGFVTPPQHRYALVTYEATYTGSHRSADVLNDLNWQLVPRHGAAIPAAGTSPPAVYAHWPTTTGRGGTVRFQVVFDVTASQLDGAVLRVGRIGSNFSSVHGDFQL